MCRITKFDGAPARACETYDRRFHSLQAVQKRSSEVTKDAPSRSSSYDSSSLSMIAVGSETSYDTIWFEPEMDSSEIVSPESCRGIRYDPKYHSLKATRAMPDSHTVWYRSDLPSKKKTSSFACRVKGSLRRLLRKFSTRNLSSKKFPVSEPRNTEESTDPLSQQNIYGPGLRSVQGLLSKPTGRKATTSTTLVYDPAELVGSRKAWTLGTNACFRHQSRRDTDNWSIIAVQDE